MFVFPSACSQHPVFHGRLNFTQSGTVSHVRTPSTPISPVTPRRRPYHPSPHGCWKYVKVRAFLLVLARTCRAHGLHRVSQPCPTPYSHALGVNVPTTPPPPTLRVSWRYFCRKALLKQPSSRWGSARAHARMEHLANRASSTTPRLT